MDPTEVESLLVACILDKTIQGKIDQVQQILELDTTLQGSARYLNDSLNHITCVVYYKHSVVLLLARVYVLLLLVVLLFSNKH